MPKIKYPLEEIEEDWDNSELLPGMYNPGQWRRRLARLFGSYGIIKIVAVVGKPVRITRYKREGE